MVTIIDNRGGRLTVPNGAYREIFKPQGWVLESEAKIEPKNDFELEKDKNLSQEENELNEYENEPENDEEQDEADENEFDEDDEDELSEIPLSEMNAAQLTARAKQLGINTKGLNGVKALREAIKKAEK